MVIYSIIIVNENINLNESVNINLIGGIDAIDWAKIIMDKNNKNAFAELFVDVQNPRPGNLQSIIVSKEKAKSLDQAKQIAKDFGAEHLQVDETETSYRFRQRNPSDFKKGSFRSKNIEKAGVTLIYGQLS